MLGKENYCVGRDESTRPMKNELMSQKDRILQPMIAVNISPSKKDTFSHIIFLVIVTVTIPLPTFAVDQNYNFASLNTTARRRVRQDVLTHARRMEHYDSSFDTNLSMNRGYLSQHLLNRSAIEMMNGLKSVAQADTASKQVYLQALIEAAVRFINLNFRESSPRDHTFANVIRNAKNFANENADIPLAERNRLVALSTQIEGMTHVSDQKMHSSGKTTYMNEPAIGKAHLFGELSDEEKAAHRVKSKFNAAIRRYNKSITQLFFLGKDHATIQRRYTTIDLYSEAPRELDLEFRFSEIDDTSITPGFKKLTTARDIPLNLFHDILNKKVGRIIRKAVETKSHDMKMAKLESAAVPIVIALDRYTDILDDDSNSDKTKHATMLLASSLTMLDRLIEIATRYTYYSDIDLNYSSMLRWLEGAQKLAEQNEALRESPQYQALQHIINTQP